MAQTNPQDDVQLTIVDEKILVFVNGHPQDYKLWQQVSVSWGSLMIGTNGVILYFNDTTKVISPRDIPKGNCLKVEPFIIDY